MRAWLRKHGDLARQAESLRGQRERVEHPQQRIATHRGLHDSCLRKLGATAAGAGESLVMLLERGQRLADRLDSVRGQRDQIQRNVTEREEQLAEAAREVGEAEEESARWHADWAKAMTRLGLDDEASPTAAN